MCERLAVDRSRVLAGGRLSPRPVAGGVSRSPVLGRADQIKGINRFTHIPIMISFKIYVATSVLSPFQTSI